MWHGEIEIADHVKCMERTTSTTTVTATSSYTLTSDCDYLNRVLWNNYKLKRIDYSELQMLDQPGYGSTYITGKPTHYYVYGESIGLWPIPDSSKSLRYYYYAQPAEVTTDSTVFSIPSMFHPYIQDYVLWRAYAKDQDDGRAVFHKKIWEENMSKAYRKWVYRNNTDKYNVVKDEDNFPTSELGII